MQMWPIYHYPTVQIYHFNSFSFYLNFTKLQSRDKLVLLTDGKLRHYIKHPDDEDDFNQKHIEKDDSPMYYDYDQGQYCMDKALSTTHEDQSIAQFAMVCSPEKVIHWTDSDFLLRKIINPICHGMSIIILLVVAIIYFVLPTLR